MQDKIYKDEMESTCLPLVFPPALKSYLSLSIISDIAMANSGNKNWIMQNFIQLCKYNDSEKIEFFPCQTFIYQNMSTITSEELNETILDINKIDFVNDIIQWINRGKYVVVYLDESKISGMRLYKKTPFLHPQFIFGYNNKLKIFKVMNFSKDTDNVDIINVPYNELETNFYSKDTYSLFFKSNVSQDLINKGYRIILLSYTPNKHTYIDTGLNIEVIKEQIKQYVYALDSSKYTQSFTGIVKAVWGVDVYNYIIDIFKRQKTNIDLRIPVLLYEHKFYMRYRLELFDKNIANEYTEIVKLAETLKLSCIKYTYSQKESMLNGIINILKQMMDTEKKVLLKLFTGEND